MRIEVKRWDSEKRSGEGLELRLCDWGGFSERLLSFVPIGLGGVENPWVEYWRVEVGKEKGVEVYGSDYELLYIGERFGYEEMRLNLEKVYGCEEIEIEEGEGWFKDRGFYVSMDGEGNIVEFRLLDLDKWEIRDL